MAARKDTKDKTRHNIHNHDLVFDIVERNKNGEVSQDELTRLIFSGAIIAGLMAYLQVGHIVAIHIGMQPAKAIGLAMGLSGILSFMYLLTVAVSLKYVQSGYIDGYKISFIQKLAFYDLSVDVLAIAPLAALVSSFRNYNLVESLLVIVGVTIAAVMLFYVLPTLWVSYGVESTCPVCFKAINKNKSGRWHRLKPKVIKQFINILIFTAIYIMANQLL